MAAEWILTTIGAQATLQRGHDITKAEQREGCIPVVSSGGVSSFHDRASAFGPGVILGRKGVVGSVYFIPSDYWPHDTTLWVKDFHGNAPRFVYYFFKWMAPRIAAMDVGSANPTLNRNHVHPIEIHWPPLPEQRAIAHILGTLDDKIELNRRMNETLEAMARAIFKSWFVDFDPVRAKAEGRDPGLPQHIADLFPDSFEDSELGEIPKGWEGKPLDQIANFHNGLALQRYRPRDGESRLPVVKIGQLRSGFADSDEWATTELKPECIIDDGDVIFSWSGSLLVKIWCGGRAALNQHLFKVTSDKFPKWFFLNAVLLHLPDFRRIAASKATTMGHIQRHHLADALTAVPGEALLAQMEPMLSQLHDRCIANELQSRSLAALRDTLLPQLISGELRVPEAEKLVEAAV